MKYLFLLLVFLSSCCPKIETSITTEVKHDTIRDTIYTELPILIDLEESKPLQINLTTLCDSIYKGLVHPQVITSEKKRTDNTRQIIATAKIDSVMNLVLLCKEDAYKDTLDSVRVINLILTNEINTTKNNVVQEVFYKDNWFIAFVLTLMVLAMLLLKRL